MFLGLGQPVESRGWVSWIQTTKRCRLSDRGSTPLQYCLKCANCIEESLFLAETCFFLFLKKHVIIWHLLASSPSHPRPLPLCSSIKCIWGLFQRVWKTKKLFLLLCLTRFRVEAPLNPENYSPATNFLSKESFQLRQWPHLSLPMSPWRVR